MEKEILIRRERGFSLIEALIAMAITLIVMAGALGVIKSMTDMSFAASQTSETSQNTQTALNLMRRDLQKTDNVFVGNNGIPLRNPTTGSNPWNSTRCLDGSGAPCATGLLPEGTPATPTTRPGLPASTTVVFDAVTPMTVNGRGAISILYADSFARRIPVTVQRQTGSTTAAQATINPGASAEVLERFGAIRRGDIILLENPANTDDIVLQVVTSIPSSTTIWFGGTAAGTSPPADLTGLNQSFAPSAAITYAVTLMRRVTYYVEDRQDEEDATKQVRWLMRQVNTRAATPLIPGITEFRLSYDIANTDGVGIAAAAVSSPTAIQRMNIRKVNVTIANTSPGGIPNRPAAVNTVTTSMAVRRYVSRFDF